MHWWSKLWQQDSQSQDLSSLALSGFSSTQLVVIESPYKGDIERNTIYARAAVRDSLLRGEAPIASHLLHTQPGILRDDVPAERLLGMRAGHAWISKAGLVAVYHDLGISSGMNAGIDVARNLGISVEYRRLDKW